ncbi:MAG: ribosome recycling factor [Pseudomonadota bacterium]
MLQAALLESLEEKMKKTISTLDHELSGIRTGRASTHLIEPIIAEAYGSKMPISQLATVSAMDARTLAIQVWDKDAVKAVEKAISNANLGVNPQTEGQTIRITLPTLTEERRNEFAKMASKYGEGAKIAIRNLRRDSMEEVKKTEKSKEISEDESKKLSDKVQKITDTYTKNIDDKVLSKEKEIKQI